MSSIQPPRLAGANEDISALIEVLRATDQRLDELLGGQVDSVTDREGQTILLRRAQGHLRESEHARQAAILSALPAGIALLDAKGCIISVNLAWRLFGPLNELDPPATDVGANYVQTWEQAYGKRFPEAAAVAAGIRSVIDGQATNYSVEYCCPSPTEQRWIMLHVSALPDGPFRGAVVMQTNISKRVQAAHALAELSLHTERRERKLTTMLSSISDYTCIFDREGRFLFANQPLLDLWGIASEAAVGRNFLELGYPPAVAESFQRQIQEVFRTGANVSGESLYLNPAREPAYHESIFSPAFAVDGSVDFVVGCTRDVTQRKRSEMALSRTTGELRELNADLELRVRERTAELNLARDEAEQANRAKSGFLASMSHEIRTPMTGLLGLLELLDLSRLDDEQHATLTVARQSGNELLRIIDDILDFSKIEADGLELNPAAGSVSQLVDNVCRPHRQIASVKGLSLDAEVAPGISPLLLFDSLRLGQILNNFLNNAIKFTDRGTVSIAVGLAGESEGRQALRFLVRDTGIGMSPEQLGRLFQPFVQAAPETSARYGGSGLGLVISRQLAKLMDGTVHIESKPGQGTTLTLSVMFDVCAPGARPNTDTRTDLERLQALMAGRRSAPTATQAEADGTLLLVVDDHPTNRMVLMRQVASLGYAAEAAADGVEALHSWRSGRFGAILTDCNMPGMTGYELSTAIRSEERRSGKARIPIIACTANALPAAVDLCIAAGMDDCLVKPASLAAINQQLDRWVPLGRVGPVQPGAPATPGRTLPALGTSQGLLDLALLSEISGGDRAAQAGILHEFRRANALDAAELRRVAASNDLPQVIRLAHRIKGSSLMLGATLLAEVCVKLEAACAASAPAEVLALMCRFETELLRLDRYLDAFAALDPPTGR